MFESIAMICYLSMVEPKEVEFSIKPNTILMETYTGGGSDPTGTPPTRDPKKDDKKKEL